MAKSLFQVNKTNNSLTPLRASSADLEKTLEDWVFSQPQAIEGPSIFWIRRQDKASDGSRSDLVGLDSEGSIIVCELKNHFVTCDTITQCLRYAAEYSTRTPSEIDEIYTKQQRTPEETEHYINFKENLTDTINSSQRLILIGTGIDADALSVIRYLSSYGNNQNFSFETYEFNCFVSGNGDTLVYFQKTFPPPDINEIIEEKRAERSDKKYGRDQNRINWMKLFIEKSKAAGVELFRKRGTSYFATLGRDFENLDAGISVEYPELVCIYAHIDTNINEMDIGDEIFSKRFKVGDYYYYQFKNIAPRDELTDETFNAIKKQLMKLKPTT